MTTRNEAKSVTSTATAAIPVARCVSFTGGLAGANGLVRGVSVTPAAKAGDDHTIDILGETVVEAGGTFSAAALLSSNASSQAVSGGTKPFARALEDATAAGQRVRVFLLPNNT